MVVICSVRKEWVTKIVSSSGRMLSDIKLKNMVMLIKDGDRKIMEQDNHWCKTINFLQGKVYKMTRDLIWLPHCIKGCKVWLEKTMQGY